MTFADLVEVVGKGLDLAGVVAIVGGIIIATAIFAKRFQTGAGAEDGFRRYRQGIGRAILLGLELLVAADIVRTVAVSPTFRSVGVLALIVLVRTFLSFTLEVELERRWPWQERRARTPADGV